ncbi:hypothetical protein Hamer_G015886 [Homarus americanus]|uniref:Uncharacterized protein n=1 Tax=Homarus americanus TaxID=6706 RepID=A0A8J5JPN7_HOMAM|nr:hypothetical protein Hamer_G015886 [Homarus americanus]
MNNQQLRIDEMLEEDENQQEQQPTQEDDVKPGEPTTHQLTDVLKSIKRVMEEYKALYKSRVNAHQQALITRYLCKAQPVNALANITSGDDDDTTDDDIELLGDLLVEELPQDF